VLVALAILEQLVLRWSFASGCRLAHHEAVKAEK
jgi:hypothetical protein